MTRLPTRIAQSALLLVILLLSSCIDIREEFWVFENGSARGDVTCLIPRAATLVAGGDKGIRKLVDELLGDDPNIDSYQLSIRQQGNRREIRIRFEVGQLMRLDRLRDTVQRNQELPEAVRLMVGSLDVQLDGLSAIEVKRVSSPGEAAPALKWLPAAELENHSLTKIIHYPYPVRSSNAHSTSEDGCTIRWNTPLKTAIERPVIYEFSVPLPIPWRWITAGGMAITALLAWWWRRRKRRRTAH